MIADAEKAGQSSEHILKLRGYLKVMKRLKKKFKGAAAAKTIGHVAVVGSEAVCAVDYAACIKKEDDSLERFLGTLQHSHQKAAEINVAVDPALDAHTYGDLACATTYLACGLGCLCPISFF